MNSQVINNECRPREHLVTARRLYPEAWKMAEEFRVGRGKDLPAWPNWCYLPLSASYAIISGNAGISQLTPHLVSDVGRLGALITWRMTQGIYRFDPIVFDAVTTTAISGDLPHDVLYKLPEWCIYIETPGLKWVDDVLYGFFTHLEWDANTGRPELRLLMDTHSMLIPIPLHLGTWSLLEAVQRMLTEAGSHIMDAGIKQPFSKSDGVMLQQQIEPLLSLVLYLCAANSEIGDGSKRPINPKAKSTKKGLRIFQADKTTIWDVGVRLGTALTKAYRVNEKDDGTLRSGPRAHIRRAHWHGFWNGPKNTPGERHLALKWIPPTPVNVDCVDELPATIRPVKE